MPRPKSLTQGDIAAAALAIIDREGLVALSMRAVAAELQTGTMSLYRYVRDRVELERLVVNHVLGHIDPAPPPRAPWREQITFIAELIRDAVIAHPAIVPLFMAHRHASPAVQRCAEAFLRALTDAGFRGRTRVIALRALISYLNGALQAQHLGSLAGSGTTALAELQQADFPLLVETARAARHVAPEQEFRGGLGIVLEGLARQCAQKRN